MVRNVLGEVTEIWAVSGDTVVPPVTFQNGWNIVYSQSGGLKPERTSFNFLFRQLYAMGLDVSQFGGALPYSATIDFKVDAFVTFSNNAYICIQANGPTTAVKAPTDIAFWKQVTNDNFYINASGVTLDLAGGDIDEVGTISGVGSTPLVIGSDTNTTGAVRENPTSSINTLHKAVSVAASSTTVILTLDQTQYQFKAGGRILVILEDVGSPNDGVATFELGLAAETLQPDSAVTTALTTLNEVTVGTTGVTFSVTSTKTGGVLNGQVLVNIITGANRAGTAKIRYDGFTRGNIS